jgi:hypothetical protein
VHRFPEPTWRDSWGNQGPSFGQTWGIVANMSDNSQQTRKIWLIIGTMRGAFQEFGGKINPDFPMEK